MKERTNLTRLFVPLLFLMQIGCNLSVARTPDETATEHPQGGEAERTSPAIELATQAQELQAPSEDLEVSPSYAIYVGMRQQGFCGPTTNSGWFSGFDFDSAFQNVRFIPPGPEVAFPNGGFWGGSTLPMQSVHGEGSVSSYAICPDYDGRANENTVTKGPKPFEPTLQIPLTQELAPVPPVGDTGPHVAILFNMGSASGGGSIMEWESSIGKGVLGGPFDTFNVVFSVGWQSIMAGEDFEVQAIYQDEGEIQEWTMRFVAGRE
jgi:hypothetical protein